MKLFDIVQAIWSGLTEPVRHVVIREIPPGRVLDVGGGGEGVIAQVGGARIVAVDRYLSEIDEARGKAPASTWMVADATALPCPNRCFDHATAFFSCMYMPDDVKQRVFRETRRVLKKGGEFWIWDTPMAAQGTVFAVRLRVDIPGTHPEGRPESTVARDGRARAQRPSPARAMHTIKTMYGVKAKDQSAASICRLLREAGFEPEVIVAQRLWFLIKARAENYN